MTTTAAVNPIKPEQQASLEKSGWVMVARKQSKYTWVNYWDHREHQKEDGSWYTQAQAVAKQREIRKAGVAR